MQGHRRSALTNRGYRGCIRAVAAGHSRTTFPVLLLACSKRPLHFAEATDDEMDDVLAAVIARGDP